MRITNFIVIAFLLLLVSDIQAQKKKNPFSSANTRAISNRAGLWLNLGLGPRILNTNPGSMTTFLANDSSPDNPFQSTVDVEDSYTRLGIQPAIGYTHPWGLSHTVFADITFSNNFTFLYGYSLGWDIPFNIGSSRFILRPAAHAALGEIHLPLGKIENEVGGSIELNGNTYYSNFLRIWIYQQIYTYGPQLDFTSLFPSGMGLTLSVAYDFAQNINTPRMYYSTPAANTQRNGDDALRNFVKLDHSDLNVEYNDVTIDQLPHEYGGFRVTLSFTGF